MQKKHICGLYFLDHRKHPVIVRQIPTMLKSGLFDLIFVDRSEDGGVIEGLEYAHINVGTAQLSLFSRWAWWFLKRVLPTHVAHAYWVFLSSLQTILTGLRFVFRMWGIRADVYIAHDIETLPAAVIAARVHRRPVVYDAHELASEQLDPTSVRNRVLRRLEDWLIPRVDLIIVPNQSRADFYQGRHRLRSKPLVVLNCPPTASWPKTDRLRELLQLPVDSHIVVYHGGFLPGRALEELIQAARYFYQDTVLVMIGERSTFFRDTLEPLWRAEGLENRVFFLPHMPYTEVMQVVASADLGVVIYKNINQNNYLCAPLKMYEYIMAEVPFVGPNFPEIERLLAKFPVGLTFNPDNPLSIAQAVNRFFSFSAAERTAMINSLCEARQRFTWEIEGEKLMKALQELS